MTDQPPSIDQQKLDLDRRRVAIEESWPKRWGGILIPASATLMVAIVSAAVSYITTENTRINARVANDRAALEIYFENVKKSEPCADSVEKIQFIKAITQVPALQALFDRAFDCSVQDVVNAANNTPATDTTAPTDEPIAKGLPNSIPPELTKELTSYTAYIQYPAGKKDAAERLQSALAAMGLRVPGIEQVKAAPNSNEVRFYSGAARDQFGQTLGKVGDLEFKVRALSGSNLPTGVIEFWLGKS